MPILRDKQYPTAWKWRFAVIPEPFPDGNWLWLEWYQKRWLSPSESETKHETLGSRKHMTTNLL